MIEKANLNEALAALPASNTSDFVMGRLTNGTAVQISKADLLKIMEEVVGFPFRKQMVATDENLDNFKDRGYCFISAANTSATGPNDHGLLICGRSGGGGVLQVIFSIRNKIYQRYMLASGTFGEWHVYEPSVYNT